jgi:anti-anti-sigma regulatory factor
MKLNVRKEGKLCVFEFSGTLAIGEGTKTLRRTFREQIGEGERLYIFNMLEVPWLDSSAIGEVVACHKRARDADAVVKLVMKDRAHDIFTNLELQRVFDIFETMEPALASFVK